MKRLGTVMWLAWVGAATPAMAQDDAEKGPVLADEKAPPTAQGVKLYEQMVRDEPDNLDARLLLAVAYAELDKFDAARREIGIALQKAPDDVELVQAKGLIEERADKYSDALAAFEKTVALAPQQVEGRLDVARMLTRLGRDKEADQIYQTLLDENAENAAGLLALATAFTDLGRFDEAESAYARTLALDPNNVPALIEKARMLANRRRLGEALGVLAQAQKAAPKDAVVHYNRGVVLFRMERYKAAAAAFEAAAKSDERMAKALNNLGVTLSKMGKNEPAIQAFDDALAIEEDFADAHYNRGLASFKLSRWRQAEQSFEKTLAIDPDYADAKFYLGEVYYQLKEPEKALSIYKQALRMNPDDAATHRRIGDMYLDQGKIDLAVGEYWAAVDADDRLQDNVQQLMLVLSYRAAKGDLGRAISAGQAGLEKDPYALETRKLLAELLLRTGKPLEAFKVLDKGVELTPNDARAHAALGMHHLDRGKAGDAKRAFDKALSIDKQQSDALYGLARITLDTGGSRDEGIARLKRALKADPAHVAARTRLGCEYQRMKKQKLAIKELKRALEDDPRFALAWYCRARAESQRDDIPASEVIANVEKYLKKTVLLQNDMAEAHYDLATLYKKLGKKEAARDEYKKTVDLDSANEKALLEYQLLAEELGPPPEAP